MSSKEESSTMESVQKDIQCLRKVFSIVRLVKAAHPEAHDTEDGSTLSAGDDDSRRSTCEFCAPQTHQSTFTDKGMHLHFKVIDGKMYQIFVRPLMIEGVPYVLEMLKHIDNTDLFLAEGYDQLMSFSQQLYIDALTGAYNRRFWEDKMKSFSGVAGIALIDLDDLKLYNDTFGHSAGDAALKALVQITKKGIRMILDGECGLFNPLLLDCLLDIKDSLKEELEKSSTGLAIHQKIPDGIIRDL